MAVTVETRGARGVAFDPAGFGWFLFAVAAGLPLFWTGLAGLAAEWSRPEYSHGPIIPLLSFYIFLRETKAVPPPVRPVTDRWPGVLVIATALTMALLGNLVAIDDIVFYALIVWTAGLILVGFGFSRGVVFWASVVHLVFMLPLPQFLYWKLTVELQFVSSEIGVWLVRAAGVPVFLDGNVIDLGTYKLLVAEACSGLRYLFPIMSFSYVFAVLYRGPFWHRIALLLAAAPIAVLMNALRIGAIGILVDRYGIGQAEGFLHFFEGWVIFLSCVGLLFLLAIGLQRLTRHPRPLSEAVDLDFSGLGAELRRVLTLAPSRAMVAAACLTAALSAAWVLAPARPVAAIERDPFSLMPRELAGWSGAVRGLEPAIEAVLGADDYVAASFSNPEETAPVDLFAAYYLSQTGTEGIHSPEVCIPAGGWEIVAIAPVQVRLAGGTGFRANRAVIRKDLETQLVYYWFETGGRRLTNDFAVKFYTVADGLLRGRTDGALVRVITPIGPDGAAAAEARLARFLEASLGRLGRHLPE